MRFFLCLLVCAILYKSCVGTTLGKDGIKFRDNDDKDDDCDWRGDDCDEWELSEGAIVGIVIAVLFIFFGIPILLCFFCAWCCFRNRRRGAKVKTTIVAAPAPLPAQYQHPNPNYYGSTLDNSGNLSAPYLPTNSDVSGKSGIAMPTAHAPTAPYPVQHTTLNYHNPAADDTHIYEQPPPYFEDAVSQSNQNPDEVGWKIP